MTISYSAITEDSSASLTCCQRACPAGTDVSTYLALIARGQLDEALAVVREVNPFPSVCGRVCDHACESYCRRAESDQSVAIRSLKRTLADRERAMHRRPETITPWRTGKIAVIGSGPAGLTAASDLVRQGFSVTVFEALPKAGGMMRVGIPDYRLPAEVLDHDIDYLLQLGVELRTGSMLGRDFTLADLKSDGFSAVLLATGAHGSRQLKIPGADDPSVIAGIDFLRQVKLGDQPAIGPRVVVIGGGDVAMDTARTALRSGATQVDMFCLEPRHLMPAHDWEITEALDEQIHFNCGWGPVAINCVRGVRSITFAACTSLFDIQGRFAPTFDPTRMMTVEADTILVAIGQYATFALSPGDGVEITERQLYRANPDTLQTTLPWVFAAGDAVTGTATVIKAVASGHKAAASICEYLNGQPLTGRWELMARHERISRAEIPADWEERTVAIEEELPPAERISSFTEVKAGISEQQAIVEAARCMRCDADTKSYNYRRAIREEIYAYARDIGDDETACLSFLWKKLAATDTASEESHIATLDDLVFLPANLTRLVIDPYREGCNTRTILGAKAGTPLELTGPLVVGGLPFAEMDSATLDALYAGTITAGIAIRLPVVMASQVYGAKVIGVLPLAMPISVPAGLSAIELTPSGQYSSTMLRDVIKAYRALTTVPIGITLTPTSVETDIQAAVEAGADFVSLSAMGEWQEDEGVPDIEVLTRAVTLLRSINREEEIDILYFGGIRNGADVARVLGMGATVAMIGISALLAVGMSDEDGHDADRLARFVTALLMEASILARCCGKTDVLNIEPEDMRSLTIETSHATGVPLVGSDTVFRHTSPETRIRV